MRIDQAELAEFLRIMDKTMVKHDITSLEIPYTYEHKLPQYLPDTIARVQTKFLDHNEHFIEEMAYRNPKHPLPQWFIENQIRYFAKFGILAHDVFYQSRMRAGSRNHLSPNLCEVRNLGMWGSLGQFIQFGRVNGATLTCGSTANINGGNANTFQCAKFTGGVIGQYYNQVAVNFNSAPAGNTDIGVYPDSSGSPGTKYAETGSIQADTAFTLNTITEFALTDTTPWCVFNSAVSTLFRYDNTTDGKTKTLTYAVPLEDNPTGLSANPNANCKIAHS